MLRHRFPFRNVSDLRQEREPTAVPPVMKAPYEVTFRQKTPLDDIAASITKYTRVKVTAAVGAGKSTNFPRMLAEKMDVMVVHAVPSEFLATDLYDYLSKLHPNVYTLVLDEGDELPQSGVAITSYPWVTGKMLNTPKSDKPFGDCVFYADEVHESDCYVEFVRRMVGTVQGVRCFVEASATFSPDVMPQREQLGEAETQFFPKISPDKWQPADVGMPWSATSSCNMVLYVDEKSVAETLVARYGECGVEAYRLHSKMDRQQFRRAMKAMRDRSGRVVVFVADYTFRNGFTMDVQRIIDSGIVKYYVYDSGTVRPVRRVMYLLEKYQTLARGSRTLGSSCTYFMPKDLEFESKLCSLEGVECEGAALLFRLYGYAPPVALQAVVSMKQGPIPVNLYDALNGAHPLTNLPAVNQQSLVVQSTTQVDQVADVIDDYGESKSPVLEVKDLFSDFNFDETQHRVAAGGDDFLSELQEMSSAARSLSYGHYYACPEAYDTGAMGKMSWMTILKSIHDAPLAVTGYSSEMRASAAALLLKEYNTCMVFGAAVSLISAHKEQLNVLSLRNPQQVQIWSTWMLEQSNMRRNYAKSILLALEKLRTPMMNFTIVDSPGDIEETKARELTGVLYKAISHASPTVDPNKFFSQLSQELLAEAGPEFPDEPGIGNQTRLIVHSRTTEVLGRVRHNLTVRPQALNMSERDYVEAISTFLESKGIVASAVHKLVIDAPGVDGRKIMQRVRDDVRAIKNVEYSVVRVHQV